MVTWLMRHVTLKGDGRHHNVFEAQYLEHIFWCGLGNYKATIGNDTWSLAQELS